MKLAVYQMEDRGEAQLYIEQAYNVIVSTEADFFALPEFFSIPKGDFKKKYTPEECWQEVGESSLEMLEEASRRFSDYIIGSAGLEKKNSVYCNTCPVFRDGRLLASYRKINLIQDDRDLSVSPGKETVTLDIPFGRIDLLICADVIMTHLVEKLASKSDYLFIPMSLTDPDHPKYEGYPISVRISRNYGATVVGI